MAKHIEVDGRVTGMWLNSAVKHADGVDILQTLTEEHRQLELLLDMLLETTAHDESVRREGLALCEHALLVQMEFEEAMLYPALRLALGEAAMECTLDAYAQNYAIADLLSRLMLMPPSDEVWRASLRVVRDNLERHHQDEEREIFEQTRRCIEVASLEGLGEQYQALQQQRATERRESRRGQTFASVSARTRLHRSPFATV